MRAKSSSSRERPKPEETADDDPVEPRLVGHERQRDEQEGDQGKEVEAAVDDDGGERATTGDGDVETEPACTQQVAEASRQDVVHGHSGHDELAEQEPARGRLRRDATPPFRLEPVHDAHHRDCERNEPRPRPGERVPDLREVHLAHREPEKQRAERDADHHADPDRPPAHRRAAYAADPSASCIRDRLGVACAL